MHPFTDQLTSLIDEMRQYIDQDSAYSADDAVRKLLDQAQRSLAHGDVEHAIELIGDIYLDV